MSWYIKEIGPREVVLARLNLNTSLPDSLKSAIAVVLLEPGNGNSSVNPPIRHDFARVEGHGHSGGGYDSIGKLEVELFTCAKAPPVAAPEEAPPAVDTFSAPAAAPSE